MRDGLYRRDVLVWTEQQKAAIPGARTLPGARPFALDELLADGSGIADLVVKLDTTA